LRKAQTIGSDKFFSQTRLSIAWGIRGRLFVASTNGELDKEYDYLEAAALKAAEKHAENKISGSFLSLDGRNGAEGSALSQIASR